MPVRPEVLDFAPCSIQLETCQRDAKELLGQRLVQALERDACVYAINTGLSEDKVQAVDDVVKKFFQLPEKKKLECVRKEGDLHGFANCYQERFGDKTIDPHVMEDYREAFNVGLALEQPVKKWPDDVLPDFKPLTADIIKSYYELSHRCFELCALGLGLEDENACKKYHNFNDNISNSGLRFVHYLPKATDEAVPPGTQRLTGHKDFSTVTFLLQDHIGDFQMEIDGVWEDLDRVPGAMLIICGETMERWTAGRLKAVKHRVLWPNDVALQNQFKFTHSFFAHCDDDAVMNTLDGQNTCQPMLAQDFIKTYTF